MGLYKSFLCVFSLVLRIVDLALLEGFAAHLSGESVSLESVKWCVNLLTYIYFFLIFHKLIFPFFYIWAPVPEELSARPYSLLTFGLLLLI